MLEAEFSCLFTPCYLEGDDEFGSSRLERNKKYIAYYRKLKERIGFSRIVMVDNASPMELLKELGATVMAPDQELLLLGDSDLHIFRYPEHLTRRGGADYPYCWRALYFYRDLMSMGYQKIITCDSDGFILSGNLADRIRDTDRGWISFLCKKYNFPEASLHVLCKDAFQRFRSFCKEDFYHHNGKVMEVTLPFDHVSEVFDVDRYGENRTPVNPDMDYYGQCPVDIEMRFHE